MTKQFKAKRDKRPPLDFDLTFERQVKVEQSDGTIVEEWKEETANFRARRSVPGTTLLRMARAMKKSNDLNTIGMQANELMELLEQAILPEDKEAFFALCDDPETLIELEVLAEILEWLAEEYAERPTQQP